MHGRLHLQTACRSLDLEIATLFVHRRLGPMYVCRCVNVIIFTVPPPCLYIYSHYAHACHGTCPDGSIRSTIHVDAQISVISRWDTADRCPLHGQLSNGRRRRFARSQTQNGVLTWTSFSPSPSPSSFLPSLPPFTPTRAPTSLEICLVLTGDNCDLASGRWIRRANDHFNVRCQHHRIKRSHLISLPCRPDPIRL